MNFKPVLAIFAAMTAASFAGTPSTPVDAAPEPQPIYRGNAFDFEVGGLWEVGVSTPIHYKLVPTQLSWRTTRIFGFEFADGSTLSVRNKFTAIGTWVAAGPENHYFGFSASPSVEWWNKSQTFSIYSGAGGGCGAIDSTSVPGGQGQDFTLNWFAQLGVQKVLTDTLSVRVGAMFQHMSNGGETHPNPGIDSLGFTVGCSWRF